MVNTDRKQQQYQYMWWELDEVALKQSIHNYELKIMTNIIRDLVTE